MRRFVIAIDEGTQEERNAITGYLKGKVGWWHWLADVWLVATSKQDVDVNSLRIALKKMAPGKNVIVLSVDGDHDWAGFMPKLSHEWFRKNWEP